MKLLPLLQWHIISVFLLLGWSVVVEMVLVECCCCGGGAG